MAIWKKTDFWTWERKLPNGTTQSIEPYRYRYLRCVNYGVEIFSFNTEKKICKCIHKAEGFYSLTELEIFCKDVMT